MTLEKRGHTRQASVFYFALLLYWAGTITLNIYDWHDQQRIAQIGLLFVLLVCHAAFLFRRDDGDGRVTSSFPFSFWSAALFASLALWGLASAVQARFPSWSLLEWSLLLSVCMGACVVAQLRCANGVQCDRVVLLILVGVCTLYLFGFLGRYATLFAGLPLRVWDMFPGFANIRFFGQFQTMTLPLLAVAVMVAPSALQKWGAFALLAGWWMLSIAGGTRGTWLAMAVAMAAVWLFGRATGKNWVRWQAAGIATGLLAYALLFFVVPYALGNVPELVNRLRTLSSLSLRDVLWAEAWRMIAAHPWFGVGPMHFAAVKNDIGAHPHNAALQIAAEWGVPALLMLAALVVMGFHRFAYYLHTRGDGMAFSDALGFGLFAALTAAAVQSLVDGMIVMPYSQVMLMVLAGWAMGICASSSALEHRIVQVAHAKWKECVFFGCAALLLAMVMALALPDVPHLQDRMRRYMDVYHAEFFAPRFWRQGWIDEGE